MHKVFSYVVATDTGVAPNVDGGVCTVCLCKPEIRRNAVVGDWIVGLWPMPARFRLTCVMRVARKLTIRLPGERQRKRMTDGHDGTEA